MLVAPQNYCSKIDGSKVHPVVHPQHGQYIKVGPLQSKVHLNKEQGKVWI